MSAITPQNLHEVLSKHILADGLDPVFDPTRSEAAYMYDLRTNRKVLDLFSFFATQPLGYNHPKLANDEMRALLGKEAIHRPTLSDVYTVEYGKFVDTFARMASQNHFRYFYFVEGGTLGVENALKVAFDWKVRKNIAAGRGEIGTRVIHFREAFHGRSGYTLSLTNTYDPNKYKYFAHFDWPRISNPKLRFPITDEVLSETITAEKQAIAEIKAALSKYPNEIATCIIEPIQAEGGDHHFRGEFLRELRSLADENEFLLIFDEVQTGFGLTGKMWCHDHFGVKPDLISFGKKAQIAGCAASTRVDEVKENVFHVPSRINSTWGGNLIDMIRCRRVLEIMEEDHLIDSAAMVGAYFLGQLQAWAKEAPRITNVRGRGLMIAFDLADSAMRDQMRKRIWENGAVILACGPKSIRIRPHLDFTKANVDAAMKIFAKSERELS